MNLAQAILMSIVMIGISYVVFADLRYTLRKRASKNWPTVQATIDSGIVGFRGPLSALPSILYRVHFTYTYSVDGLQYSGRFYLLAQGRKLGEEFRQALTERKVLVKYDVRHPGVSLLLDQQMNGKRVMQGPSWTYR